MKRLLIALAAILALGVSTAQAQTTIIAPPNASYPYQQWVDRAKVPTPNRSVQVVESSEPCSEPSLGCTDGSTIWIMVWPGEPVVMTLYHELGHVFAFEHPDFRHYEDERFADIYARCALSRRIWPRVLYSAGEGVIRGVGLQRQCRQIIQQAQEDLVVISPIIVR